MGTGLIAPVVGYGPGEKSEAHADAKSAFVHALSVSKIAGTISELEAVFYKLSEQCFELPGSWHGISENASTGEPGAISTEPGEP